MRAKELPNLVEKIRRLIRVGAPMPRRHLVTNQPPPGRRIDEPLVVRPKQAAQLANVSERTVWNWINVGLLPTTKIGQITLISMARLRTLIGAVE
jgi:hypothetical protein